MVEREVVGMMAMGVPASATASPNFFAVVIAPLDPESRLSFGGVLVLPREGVPVLVPV